MGTHVLRRGACAAAVAQPSVLAERAPPTRLAPGALAPVWAEAAARAALGRQDAMPTPPTRLAHRAAAQRRAVYARHVALGAPPAAVGANRVVTVAAADAVVALPAMDAHVRATAIRAEVAAAPVPAKRPARRCWRRRCRRRGAFAAPVVATAVGAPGGGAALGAPRRAGAVRTATAGERGAAALLAQAWLRGAVGAPQRRPPRQPRPTWWRRLWGRRLVGRVRKWGDGVRKWGVPGAAFVASRRERRHSGSPPPLPLQRRSNRGYAATNARLVLEKERNKHKSAANPISGQLSRH